MRWGLESVSGDGPTLKRTTDLFRVPGPRAAALGGVGAVLVSAPRPAQAPPTEARTLAIEEVAGLPRAILVPESVVVAPEDAVRATLSQRVDPLQTVVLEEGPALARDPGWSDAGASARLVRRAPGRVELDATLPAPGVLVLFDSWEAGWRASVDGVSAPVLRADAAFRGVRLTAGTHRVEFSYAPPGLPEGIGLGLAGVLGLLLAALRLRSEAGETEGLAAPRF